MDEITCTLERIVASAPISIHCTLPNNDPSWTDVFSAWGTVGATLAAVVFGAISLRLSLHERALRREQEAELAAQAAEQRRAAVRSQAERVACWLQVDFKQFNHHVVIENASDEPIWDVTIEHHTLPGKRVEVPVVVPRGRKEIAANPRPGFDFDQVVGVEFRDNAGNWWHRPAKSSGALVQLTDKDAAKREVVPVD
ncbi:MAG TPA: hypothetical protein VIQ52_09395 [Arthrobacter sp.]